MPTLPLSQLLALMTRIILGPTHLGSSPNPAALTYTRTRPSGTARASLLDSKFTGFGFSTPATARSQTRISHGNLQLDSPNANANALAAAVAAAAFLDSAGQYIFDDTRGLCFEA